jgi:UDP-N-acetylglucosamine 2-epimerase (non-hydrolysing)
MSKLFFEDLELPRLARYLNVGSATHAQQTAKIMVEFEKVVDEEKPDLVLVVGDVNSMATSVWLPRRWV